MEDNFKKIIKKIPSDKPQCYITSNMMVDKLLKGKLHTNKGEGRCIKKVDLKHLYGLKNSITSIEINIIDKEAKSKDKILEKYKIKNRFWIPRIFNHAFNIMILDDKVVISQSWFRFMNYKVIHEFTPKQFINWLDNFLVLVKCYNVDPKKLLRALCDTKAKTIEKSMIRYIKAVDKMEVQYTINFKCA